MSASRQQQARNFNNACMLVLCLTLLKRRHFESVVTWIIGKCSHSMSRINSMLSRITRNLRCPALDVTSTSNNNNMEAKLQLFLEDVFNVGINLFRVLESLSLSKNAEEETLPAFFETPPRFSFDSVLPPVSADVDDSQLFSRLLWMYLFKLFTPLRYAEDVVQRISMFVCGNMPLVRDNIERKAPRDTSNLMVAVLNQIRRLESNLSLIEVYILIRHCLPRQQIIASLVDLKTDLSNSVIDGVEYRSGKDACLERLVEFNLEKFRPTPFYSLMSPESSSRASVAPNLIIGDIERLFPNSRPASPDLGDRDDVSMDDLMALTVSPRGTNVTPVILGFDDQQMQKLKQFESKLAVSRRQEKEIEQNAEISRDLLGKLSSRGAPREQRKSGVMDWNTSDNLAPMRPRGRDDSVLSESRKNRVAAQQLDGAMGAAQRAKLAELEKLRNGGTGLSAQPTTQSFQKYIHPGTHKDVRVTARDKLSLKNSGDVLMELSISNPNFVSGGVIWLYCALENKAKGIKIASVELVLRDPEFQRVHRCENAFPDYSDRFPIKTGERLSTKQPYQLPALAITGKNARYTLTLSCNLKGRVFKKREELQLSLSVAVVDAASQFASNPHQVFCTPLELVLIREKSKVPRIIGDVSEFFKPITYAEKLFSVTTNSSEVLFLREQYDSGVKEPLTGATPHVVATLFRVWLMSLPLPLIPSNLYSRFTEAVGETNAETQRALVTSALSDVPAERLVVIRSIVSLLKELERHSDINVIVKTFGPTFLRRIGQSVEALAPGDSALFARVASLVLEHIESIAYY